MQLYYSITWFLPKPFDSWTSRANTVATRAIALEKGGVHKDPRGVVTRWSILHQLLDDIDKKLESVDRQIEKYISFQRWAVLPWLGSGLWTSKSRLAHMSQSQQLAWVMKAHLAWRKRAHWGLGPSLDGWDEENSDKRHATVYARVNSTCLTCCVKCCQARALAPAWAMIGTRQKNCQICSSQTKLQCDLPLKWNSILLTRVTSER